MEEDIDDKWHSEQRKQLYTMFSVFTKRGKYVLCLCNEKDITRQCIIGGSLFILYVSSKTPKRVCF